MAFERKLYVIRKRAYNEIRASTMDGAEYWYVASLSFKTLVYKGMLLTEQLEQYFTDLQNPAMETALALVHSRFSTNTFPSWDRAHPYRYIAHNGEINTLRGNINWMHAREALFESELFGEDIKKILPIVNPNGSDSAMFDNTLELLILAGRSPAHAMMMMIPEPWSNNENMDDDRRAFYQYHSCLMEPWDGPASIAFTDGVQIGAVLDRNGLRPSRYYVTKDGLVIMASEAGVLDIPPENILQKGRLQPGRMFLVDTEQGRIIEDEEIKRKIAIGAPLPPVARRAPGPPERPSRRRRSCRCPTTRRCSSARSPSATPTRTSGIILTPMARDGVEAVGSMGNDAALAVLSNRPRLLYDYFKQLFAQVTNPPIDCIREEIIIGAETRLGSEGNLLNPQPSACRRVELKWPILTNEEFAKIRRQNLPGLKVGVLPILFRVTRGEKGLAKSRRGALRHGPAHDRGGGGQRHHPQRPRREQDFAPVPALLAVAGLHHYLIREGLRTRVSLVLETGEAREVHHFSLLIGYGCSAINPYLAFETIDDMIREGLLVEDRPQDRLQELRQGGHEGRHQGHVEDGHLGHPELPRRAGVRGPRPAAGRDRPLLHLDAVARRRHRPRRDRAGGAHAPPRGVPAAPGQRPRAARRAASTSGATTASSTCSTPSRSTGCRRRCAPAASRSFQEYAGAHQRPVRQRLHAARACSTSSPRRRSRSRRSSRSRASSSASRPARCPTARSARRRTRRWRSP